MEKQDLINLKEKISKLSEEDKKERDKYLKGIAAGEIQGPPVGYSSIDKPWLALYSNEEITNDYPKRTLYSFLKDRNKDNMNNTLIEFYNQKILTKKVFEMSDLIADILVNNYNIKKGDKISICLPTIPETYYLALAIWKVGAVANMIDPRINEERIKECIGNDSKLVFGIDAYNQKIANATKDIDCDVISVSAAESLNKIMQIVYRKKAKIVDVERLKSWKTFINTKLPKEKKEVQDKYEENSSVAIVYTSGTTGVPKGVMLTNENIIHVAEAELKNVPDMEKGDKYLVIMPPFIAYGLVCGICCPMSTCQKMILIPKFDPKEFDKIVMKNKPNHMLGVPSFFEDLAKSKLVKNKDLSFIKYCIVGGDKLNESTENFINDFFKKHNVKNSIVKGYGMTELSSAAFTNHDNENNKVGSVGTPYLGNNVKIVSSENNEELTYNNIGEVYISSPSIMKGYVNNKEEEKKVIKVDEVGTTWVKTGDLGKVDEKGNLTIEGRIKRIIVRPDGHNVFPSTIENLLLQNDKIEDAVVVGLSSPEYENGKIPTAFIVVKDEYKGQEEEILKELVNLSSIKLPPRDVAVEYKFIDSIPLTSVGKKDIKYLEENYPLQRKVR